MARVAALKQSGVKLIVPLALSDDGHPGYPLFTDAWITREVNLGTYISMNSVAGSIRKTVESRIVLRYAFPPTPESLRPVVGGPQPVGFRPPETSIHKW
jgi:hypothetical protein